MSKITTENCKEYLVKELNKKGISTKDKDWKRTKKYKNEDGLWIREFHNESLGTFELLEKNDELFLVNENNTITNIKKDKIFDLTTFSKEEVDFGWEVYKKYYSRDEDEDEVVNQSKEFIRFIPASLLWFVPEDTYENCDFPKKINWDFNMKGFFIAMVDKEDYHEYGGEEVLLNGYLPKYLGKVDEYNYEIDKDITFEELVADLSILGYKYTNENSDKKFNKLIKEAQFTNIPFVMSKLEKDILSDKGISSYTNDELNQSKLNGQSIVVFCFENQKFELLKELIKRKVSISDYDLSYMIEQSLWSGNNESTKEVKEIILSIVLSYDNIQISNEDKFRLVSLVKEVNENKLVEIYEKFFDEKTCLTFASTVELYNNDKIKNDLIRRFSNHDEDLKDWLIQNLVYSETLTFLKQKEFREAISKKLITELLDVKHQEYFDNLKYEADRAKGGMFVVEIKRDGSQETWLEQRQKSLAKFVTLRAKILSYFDQNDEDNTPKKTYKTKF